MAKEKDKEKEKDRDIVFELKEHIGIIDTYATGWTKELNLISWNEAPPKFDIRDWNPEHERMSRGITLHGEQMRNLVGLYQGFNQTAVK